MKFAAVAVSLLAARASAGQASPIGKVIQMISDFQAKVIKEGEQSQKIYAEFSEWCEDRSRELAHEIKTGKAEVVTLKATIAEQEATIETTNSKIDELVESISTDEAELKKATAIRKKEHEDFMVEEKELMDTVDMITRATGILERELAKGGASMLQMKNIVDMSQALTAMVDASVVSSSDASKLQAFIQGSQRDASDDAEPGAPAAAVYESKSGNIVETLESLKEKADAQLDEVRKTETSNLHNYEMLKQSLEDEIKFANQDLDKAKKTLAESAEIKSTAEGDLQATSKDLAADIKSQSSLHTECMTKAEDFEAETKSRGEELKALATAKKVIEENTGAAAEASYGEEASFLQTGMNSASLSAIRLVRNLSVKHNSPALSQLAQRMGVAAHSAADPFEKVRGLITEMIAKLEEEAEADATKKAYCDKELKETSAKKADKSAEVEKLSTKIDQMKAKSASLKEEVVQLQADLAALSKSQAEADKLREEEHTAYVSNKADLEQGLNGVKLALKVLNEYYGQGDKAHTSQSGGAASIIGLLEVVESDFSKGLAEVEAEEEAAAAAYEQETKDNEVEKATKTKDVEFKTKESVHLDEESAALASDLATVQEELDAVLEYLAKIHKECDEVAETYEQRKARYEAEIAGLKEALDVLESETALVQRHTFRHRSLRGSA